MEIVRGVAGGKKRGRRPERDDKAVGAAAEGEETEVDRGEKRGGKKAAAAVPTKEVVPTPKRIKIWELSKELTDEFLMKEIGILSLAKVTLQRLKRQGVESVGSLLSLSEDKLEKNVRLPMGSVGAIMRFIEQQKGKNEE